MATVAIRVIQTGSVCRVIPPSNIFHRNVPDQVTWFNRTSDKIIVTVRGGIFDPVVTTLVIDAGGSATKTVLGTAPDGLFPYSIYCYVTNNNAIGSSDPEIIIEP
jgi:hypothetical protein